MALKIASLFAGIGGICLGFQQAGFQSVWANEIDSAACKTYRKNFGDAYLVEGDIRKIDPQDIPDFDVLKLDFHVSHFLSQESRRGLMISVVIYSLKLHGLLMLKDLKSYF